MLNKADVLFVFEGAKTEDKFIESLENKFLEKNFKVKSVFEAEIYQLYNQIKNDDELFTLDLVEMLRARSEKNHIALKGYKRDDFAFVYLFFDYDGHSSLAEDIKIKEMLSFFDDETRNGKLFLSYPMIEAIKHFKDIDTFKDLTVKCKGSNCPFKNECPTKEECLNEPHYKQLASMGNLPQLNQVNKYDAFIWSKLIYTHLLKANYIVNEEYIFPEEVISQIDIFNAQSRKFINKKCPEVAVLSSIPCFVLDYYGVRKLKVKLGI